MPGEDETKVEQPLEQSTDQFAVNYFMLSLGFEWDDLRQHWSAPGIPTLNQKAAVSLYERQERYTAQKCKEAQTVRGDTSDGYHTFNELYDFRKQYNAALFNEWAKQKKYKVHKSWHHADEPYEPIFGGGWFIVMAELPTGQISNHYEAKDWDLFKVQETPVAHAFDGHTPQDVLQRIAELNGSGRE